jgi:hypothetical protein
MFDNYYQIYEKQMPHFKVVSMQLYIIYDKSHHWITAQVSDTNYMYLYWRSIYQERRVGTPLTSLVCHICVPVSNQDLDFQHHMWWSFLCYFKVVSMQLYIIYDKSHHWITAQVSDTNKTATVLIIIEILWKVL